MATAVPKDARPTRHPAADEMTDGVVLRGLRVTVTARVAAGAHGVIAAPGTPAVIAVAGRRLAIAGREVPVLVHRGARARVRAPARIG